MARTPQGTTIGDAMEARREFGGTIAPGAISVVQALSGADLELLERLGAGLASVDPDGRVVLWNEDAARILGLAAGDAVGSRWADCLTLIRGDDTGGATMRVEILQMGGWHGPLQVRTRDGRTMWLRAHVQPISLAEFDGQPGVAAMFWIGEGPDAAVSGPDAAQLPYRDLFLSSPEALFLTDLKSIIVDANDVAAATMRTTPEDLVGKPLGRYLERCPGPGGCFVEKIDDGLAPQRRHLLGLAAVDLSHVLGGIQQELDLVPG